MKYIKRSKVMKKISSRCWEYKGFSIIKKDTYSESLYIVYDRFGFALVGDDFEGFSCLDDCEKFIDKITKTE